MATAVTEGDRHVLRYQNASWSALAGAGVEHGLGRPFAESFPAWANVESALLDRVYRTGQGERLTDQPVAQLQDNPRFTTTAWPWGGSG